jgi:hypothetical protein
VRIGGALTTALVAVGSGVNVGAGVAVGTVVDVGIAVDPAVAPAACVAASVAVEAGANVGTGVAVFNIWTTICGVAATVLTAGVVPACANSDHPARNPTTVLPPIQIRKPRLRFISAHPMPAQIGAGANRKNAHSHECRHCERRNHGRDLLHPAHLGLILLPFLLYLFHSMTSQ